MNKKNIGKEIRYSKKENATIIDEDETHIIAQLKSGTKIATAKYYYSEIN